MTRNSVLTWPKTLYDSTATAPFTGSLPGGPGVYFINLDVTSPTGAPGSGNWTGLQRALRLQPTTFAGETLSVDWVRLVSQGDPNSCQPIRWTGGSGVDGVADIYIDTDTDPNNGFYGLVQGFATSSLTSVSSAASRASAGCPIVSGAFNFNVGALPAGTYYIAVAPLNTTPTASNVKYSPGAWTVGDIPTLKFTSPTDEGSADDFAGSQLGDPWDFNTLADVDTLFNINNASIATLNMEAPDGSALPNQRVFLGTSAFASGGCQAIGDPAMVMMDFSKRGKNVVIDTNRYRLMTVEFGIPNAPRDVNCGSIARAIWHKKGDGVSSFSVSDDLIFNSRAGANLLDKITVDLKTLFVEQGVGAGGFDWNNGPGGGVDQFRFDPHEFGPATQFYVKRIKLADYERANTGNVYTIQWIYSKPSGLVDLYYTTVQNDFSSGSLHCRS